METRGCRKSVKRENKRTGGKYSIEILRGSRTSCFVPLSFLSRKKIIMENKTQTATSKMNHSAFGTEFWYDEKGDIIHTKLANGTEFWYNKKGNEIHTKWSAGDEYWYNEKGDLIHEKLANGNEFWYDEKGNLIHQKYSNGDEFWYDEKPKK
jgi:hypothetical protein